VSAVRAVVAFVCLAEAAGAAEWRTYAGGPRRLFFNPAETQVTAAAAGSLRVKWRFRAEAPVTASPSIVPLDVPGEGRLPIVFVPSWDHHLYALRARDGTELWRFFMEDQPGATFPNAASTDVQPLDGRETVFVAGGESVYAVDALTGVPRWRFDAGTGCVDPPGLCGFESERNQVESSPLLVGDVVVFGMDVNDVERGKGGFYAVDARDGRLVWYFDVETGATCRPLAGDAVRRFDGYHSEAELGLAGGFFATRPGCDHDRTTTGCGNVWSSAAHDPGRGLLYVATSNCDTDTDPATPKPPPPMPPNDEALLALRTDGTLAWRWRPREVDPDDFAFGAVPQLFTIRSGGALRDVVGLGGKDGTYYVLDRDGVNEVNGVAWDDPDPSALPYWRRNVVAGGFVGGIIATAAVDEAARRVYFSTAPGTEPFMPQRPTMHALDLDTGAVVWQNTPDANADASFSPTSGIPGVAFTGTVIGGFLRAYDTATGARLGAFPVGFTLASAPAVVDGLVVVGSGSGARNFDRFDQGDIAARTPSDVVALCAPGTAACEEVPARAGDHCLRGGSATGDVLALATLEGHAALACPCGTAQARARCVRAVVNDAVGEGALRHRCRTVAVRRLRAVCPAG
jgi:outer membrane protein assembly factor BamB